MTEERIIARAASAARMAERESRAGNLAAAMAELPPAPRPTWWDRHHVNVYAALGVAIGVGLAAWRH